MIRRSHAVAATSLALALAGCSSSSSPLHGEQLTAVAATPGPGGTQQITIDATNMFRFDPPVIKAHPGTLKITLVDTGSYPHNLSVESLHVTSQTVTGELGDTKTTFTVRFAHPGTYDFVCTFHSSAGMRGQFIVH